LAAPEIAQLLHEVALLLAPDDRHGLGVGGDALVAVACRAGLCFRLDPVLGERRGEGGHEAESQSENHRKDACDHDEIPPSPPAGPKCGRIPHSFHQESPMRAKLMLTLAATAAAIVFPVAAAHAEVQSALTGIVSSEAEGKMEGVVVTAHRPGHIVQVRVTTADAGL